MLARSSFGVWGTNLPAMIRAVVACFWYGAQTAAASGAIVALLTRNDTMLSFHQNSRLLGHSVLEDICFLVVWALQLLIIQNGMETIRKFQDWAGPAVWVAMLMLAVYLVIKAGGFSLSQQISQDVILEKTKNAGVIGLPGSTTALAAAAAIWVTYFAALYLNFCDFSRFAKDKAGGTRPHRDDFPHPAVGRGRSCRALLLRDDHESGEELPVDHRGVGQTDSRTDRCAVQVGGPSEQPPGSVGFDLSGQVDGLARDVEDPSPHLVAEGSAGLEVEAMTLLPDIAEPVQVAFAERVDQGDDVLRHRPAVARQFQQVALSTHGLHHRRGQWALKQHGIHPDERRRKR